MNMRVKLFLRFLIISFLITAVSACQLFENDVDDFMQKYTETAAIEDHEFSVEPYPDINENLNISSKEDISIDLIMRNPKKFNMIPSAEFSQLDAAINRERVNIYQVDEETVKLILPQSFLVPADEGKNISADISLYEPMSGRTFDIYTVELFCNSIPPLILNPTVVNNAGSTFVIAFDMPNEEDVAIKHKDLASVEIEGVSYPVKIKTEADSEGILHAIYQFSDPRFTRDWSPNYIIINQKDFSPNRNSVYFDTGIPFSAVDKEFTIYLRDAAGLESSVKASTSISKLVKPVIKDQNGSIIRETGIAGIPFDEDTKTGKITIIPPTQDHLGNPVSGATVHYTVYEATGSGLIYTSGSATDTTTITLPQNTYRVEAYATLTNYENSSTRTVKFRFINNLLYVKAGFVNGDGSEGAPFATINEALADINSRSNHESVFTIYAEDDGALTLNDEILILPSINTDFLTLAKKPGAASATIKSLKLESGVPAEFKLNVTDITVSGSASEGISLNSAVPVNLTRVNVSNSSSDGVKITAGTVIYAGGTISGAGGIGLNYAGGTLAASNLTIADSGSDGIRNTTGNLSLSNIEISHSGAVGINNTAGNLTCENVTINTTVSDGIKNAGGNLSLTDVTITASGAVGINNTTGALTCSNVTVTNSTSDGIKHSGGTFTYDGGEVKNNGVNGINVTAGTLTYEAGTISENTLHGIKITSAGPHVYNNGTISGNDDGIYIGDGTLTYNNGTITGNTNNGITALHSSFTLNNGTITNNDGGVYSDGSTLNISGGIISENSGDGIYQNDGILTITGGTISSNGNCGVYIESGTSHTISGGSIINNTSYGIYGNTSSSITLTGGTITGNQSGGIAFDSTIPLQISGNPIVKNNTVTSGGTTTTRNIFLAENGATIPITIIGPLTTGCDVGITTASVDEPTVIGGKFSFTTGYGTYNTAAPSTYFKSDRGLAISPNGSGSSMQASIALSGATGTIPHNANDYNFTFAITDEAGNTGTNFYAGFYPGSTKNFVINPTVTRTDAGVASATPLTYSAGTVDGSAVTWKAELYNGGSLAADLTNSITATTSGIKVGVTATLTDTYILKITATYLGIDHTANFTLNCSKNADSVADLIRNSTTDLSIEIEGELNATELNKVKNALSSLYMRDSLIRISIDATNSTCSDPSSLDAGGYFKDRFSLSSMILPEWMLSLPQNLFNDCVNLTSITIPDTVEMIKANAFTDCTSLTTINYGGTIEQWKAITRIPGWHTGVPATTEVHCSDGNCSLDARFPPIGSNYMDTTPDSIAVGDIVFNDGSYVHYNSTLTLTPAQQAAAIAVIFYIGDDCNNSGETGNRILGVGLVQASSIALINWGTPYFEYYLNTDCDATETGGSITITGKKNGKNNHTTLTVSSDTPGFEWALDYKNKSGSHVEDTMYEDGWYIPSLAELYHLSLNVTAVESSLTACSGTTFGTDDYWSSSQNTHGNGKHAWTLTPSSGAYEGNQKHTSANLLVIHEF